jgi:hypothetical protein
MKRGVLGVAFKLPQWWPGVALTTTGSWGPCLKNQQHFFVRNDNSRLDGDS